MTEQHMTLDRDELAERMQQAKLARAEHLRRYASLALTIGSSGLAILLALGVLYVPQSTNQRQLAATAQMERFANKIDRAARISPESARQIEFVISNPEYDCEQMPCRSTLQSRNKAARSRLLALLKVRAGSDFSSAEPARVIFVQAGRDQ